MNKPLNQKTIRPGSLSNYSYYYAGDKNKPSSLNQTSSRNKVSKKILLVPILLFVGYFGFQQLGSSEPRSSISPAVVSADKEQESTAKLQDATAKVKSIECSTNTLDKLIVVSIDQRKMWACEGTVEAYSASIISGDMRYPETETPKGSYKIFAKEADTVLRGADTKGKWEFPVATWMPFLDNKHGTYGFHDANWKDQNSFGTVDPYVSDKASHGCIELSDGAAAWLFAWAKVGTALTIK